MTPMDPMTLKWFAIATVALVAKMAIVGGVTGAVRNKVKQFVNTEDARLLGGSLEGGEYPSVARWQRIHRNDVENIPPFLLLALVYTMVGGSATGMMAYAGVFVLARYAHMFFYAREIQPFRTASYGVGQLCVLGLIVTTLMQIL